MFNQDREHAPAADDDSDQQGPVKLAIEYPLIASPLTPQAKFYNAAIAQFIPRWWKDFGGPKDNSQTADPNTDISLICAPVGIPPEYGLPPQEAMLPDVISMTCSVYAFPLDAAHGGGSYSGFNWLVSQHRLVRASDIFIKNAGWLKALTALADADRQDLGNLPSWAPKLDFADTRHWVLGADGLGLAYSAAQFTGFEEGGLGGVDVIPWAKLTPYLRKDGIVPQSDWTATLPPTNHS